jgi:hypothetical protein
MHDPQNGTIGFRYTHGAFILMVAIGCYFFYIRPKLTMFESFRKNPDFANYMLIIESNAEFNQESYEKAMKHIKLFLMYYSEAFEKKHMFEKMKMQHNRIRKYLNRMLLSVPNGMRRHAYLKNAVENIDIIFKEYLTKIAQRYDIQYIPI